VALADHLANAVQCAPAPSDCYGTKLSDHMYGTEAVDWPYEAAGDDQIDVSGGDDKAYGSFPPAPAGGAGGARKGHAGTLL
jgi:hypothetical protein